MVSSYEKKSGTRWKVVIGRKNYAQIIKGGFVYAKDARNFEVVTLSELIRGKSIPDDSAGYGTLNSALESYAAEVEVDEPFRDWY